MNCPWTRHPWTFLRGSSIPWILRFETLGQIIPDWRVPTLDGVQTVDSLTSYPLAETWVAPCACPVGHQRVPKLRSPNLTQGSHHMTGLYRLGLTFFNITLADPRVRTYRSGTHRPEDKNTMFRDTLIRDTSSCTIDTSAEQTVSSLLIDNK